jgi:zinc protease
MRILLWCALLSVGLAPVADAQRATLERMIQRRTLDNGMEIVVVENHGVPLVTLEVNVRNGAFTQTPETEGVAHLYEHMFFKGSTDFPDPDAFLFRAAELGATFNGTTQEERVNYYVTLPADSVEGGMAWLAGALRSPTFDAAELRREQEVVIGEYDRAESSPYFGLSQRMDSLLYGDQVGRKNTIGRREVIRGATPRILREIQRRYYVPNNSVLIIAGDVDPARAFALAAQQFGDWPRAPDPFEEDPIPAVPPLEESRAVIAEQPVSDALIMIQWQGPSVREDPEATYAADVFSDVLNGAGSTLQKRLVESGLFQSVGVNYYTLANVGPISIAAVIAPEKVKAGVAALHREIAQLADSGYYTSAELEPVKRQRAVSTMLNLERASGFAHQLGFWWSVVGLDYFMGYVDNMAARSVEDLRAYARKYIVGKPYVVGAILSPDVRRTTGLRESDLLSPPEVP